MQTGMDSDAQKVAAAEGAMQYVENGMKLGLGTGSTAAKFVYLVGKQVAEGLEVLCVPTSEATRALAEEMSIPLTTLDDLPHLDLTVDGADELDSQLRLIKGGGGALLREKIVATASDRMVVIADDSKHVDILGRFPLPVEIERFGMKSTQLMIEAVAREANCEGDIIQRMQADGSPYLSDGENFILDCAFNRIPEPEMLADALNRIPGVVEHGLFLDIADVAVVAGADGVKILERSGAA